MGVIQDSTLQGIVEQIGRKNAVLLKFINEYTPTSWLGVQANVRAGKAKEKYAIGDELICEYVLDGVTYAFPWVVLDNDRECEWQDGTKHPGLWLGAKYATIEDIQFDAPEQEEATEETAQEGLYYCGRNGNTYTLLNLAAGATIPYGDHEHVYHSIANNRDVFMNGYNRYLHSAQRQWLNSAAGVGEWWTAQHVGDCPPSQLASRKGFMAGLDNDFLSVITAVKVQVTANTVTDGGVTDVMYDKFFLQSLEEMYGVPQLGDIEGPYFPYWKQITGLETPSNGSSSQPNDARKIRRINAPTGSAAGVRLRSCYRGHSNGAWHVNTGGYLTYSTANYSYAAQPACVIS